MGTTDNSPNRLQTLQIYSPPWFIFQAICSARTLITSYSVNQSMHTVLLQKLGLGDHLELSKETRLKPETCAPEIHPKCTNIKEPTDCRKSLLNHPQERAHCSNPVPMTCGLHASVVTCWCWSLSTLATWCKSHLTGKDPDAGKDWRQEENRVTEDEMVGWHHRLNGHEFEQTLNIVKNREAWRAAVHGVAKSQTWRSNFTGSLVATEQHGPYFLGESDYRPHSKILWVQFSDHCKEQIL